MDILGKLFHHDGTEAAKPEPLDGQQVMQGLWDSQHRPATPEPVEQGHLLPDEHWAMVQRMAGDSNG